MVADRLTVDPIMCHAHGLCAELLPEMVRLDEWGYPILDDGPVPPAIRSDARSAVAACPTLALKISRESPAAAPPSSVGSAHSVA